MENQPLCHVACSSDQSPVHPKSFFEKCRRSFFRQSSRSDKHHQPNRKDMPEQLRKSTSSRYLLIREDSSSSVDHFIDRISGDADLDHLQDVGQRCNSPTTSRPKSTLSYQQAVVLRVSLHCKGCERKLRKHLSRMEGVSSFSIDLSAKKVTVIGDVTPLSVLTSVSKVMKNTQLWPSRTYSLTRPASQQSAG